MTPPPIANPLLIGHSEAEQSLLRSWVGGRVPHAWLLTGPPGIGKATLAYRFARFLLANPTAPEVGLFAVPPPTNLALDPDHPVFRRVAAGGHPDLMVVEREIDQKTKRERGVITVDQIREIGHFLHLTASEGGRRIVIIDPIDDLNSNGANSLLKLLEEPPENTVLMLISNMPGGLLPTIRSRCRRLALNPLSDEEMTRWFATGDGAAPDAVSRLAGGSPGRALALMEEGAFDLYRDIVKLLGTGDLSALNDFSDRLSRATAVDTFKRFADLYPWFLSQIARSAGSGEALSEIVGGEGALAARLVGRVGLDRVIEVWEKTVQLLAQAIHLNLDRKQTVLEVLSALT
jgi:DNA polymerase-3 subunit delta'